VDVADGLIVLPGDEVRGSLLDLLAQAVERQAAIDPRDLVWH